MLRFMTREKKKSVGKEPEHIGWPCSEGREGGGEKESTLQKEGKKGVEARGLGQTKTNPAVSGRGKELGKKKGGPSASQDGREGENPWQGRRLRTRRTGGVDVKKRTLFIFKKEGTEKQVHANQKEMNRNRWR